MVTIFNSDSNQIKKEPEKKEISTSEDISQKESQFEPKLTNSTPEFTTGDWLDKFSPPIAKLIETYRDYYLNLQTEAKIAVIHVDEIASKVALFYEKIRKIVDWKEEQLVRRGAIERILKRRMLSELSGINLASEFKPDRIAEPLIIELVRGGHFPNDKIPSYKVNQVQKILEKYTYILENNPLAKKNDLTPRIKKKINFYNWILEIAACEIEETLEPPIRENALIESMVSLMDERIQVIPPEATTPEGKRNLIFIAVHRTLFHLDSPIISYRLLKNRFPQWKNPSESLLKEITQNIFSLINDVEKDLSHPLSGKFAALCEKHDTLYLLFGDTLDAFSEKPNEIPDKLVVRENLVTYITGAYQKRISTLRSRLYRAAVYSTLSVFIAGSFSLFIFEVPLATLVYGHWSLVAIIVDLLLPTIFMAFLVAIVKPPGQRNLETITRETLKIVYPTEEKDIYHITIRKKRGIILRIVLSLIYLLVTFVSLGLIFWFFQLARVPVTSLYIDTLNVAMIVFAALVIRQRAKELTVEERTSFWEFSIDNLSVPIARIGQWLSAKWREYNLVSVFFMALIDTPFSKFIGFIEDWSSYLKEKKSEISH